MTILEVLDVILRESESLSLDSPADRKRLRDSFEYLMRSQDPHGHGRNVHDLCTGCSECDGCLQYPEDRDQPLYRLD